MALAKWFGQPQPVVPSAARPPASERAKTVTTNKAECKQFGLENFGNTCYINSVLQALYFCHPFRELIIQTQDKSYLTAHPGVYSSPAHCSSAPTNSRAKNQRKLSSAEDTRASGITNANGNPPLPGPIIPSSPPTMFSALRSLFVHISCNSQNKGVVAPKAFVEKLKKENELFRSTMHQDAHEFLIYLLNKVAEDVEEETRSMHHGNTSGEDLFYSIASLGAPSHGTATPRTSTLTRSNTVHDLFEGVLTSETRCLTCETVSSRDEAFLDLSIDIEQNSSVTACLRQFSASEMLCQKNKFFCDSCCGLQEAEKRMKIKRLPNVLALHLKRFKYQEDVGKYIKLAYRVAFPLELRLFNTADDAEDPDRLYELFAIVVHIGNGPHHGHYVAIVKSTDSWLVFDDDSVENIKESDITKYFGDSNSGAAYVLYYQALDLDLAGLGLKVDEPGPMESGARTSPKQIPLLPPGLTHEGDSDASEFAPATPASPAIHSDPAVASGSPPALAVTIPSDAAASGQPASSPASKTNGFFNSLRNSPSKPSIRPGSRHSTLDTTNVPPVPSLPTSPAHPHAPAPQIHSEISVASNSTTTTTTSHIPNGRPRTPMSKAGGWITRKLSARPEKEKPSDHVRPASSRGIQGSHRYHDSASLTSSSSSSRVPMIPNGSPDPNSSVPTSETPSLLPAFSESTKKSTPNNSTSSSIVPPHFQNGSAILPTSPSTKANFSLNHTAAHNNSHHRHHFHLPNHKKSQPLLHTMSPPPPEERKLPHARPPKRPSTAGATESPTHGMFKRIDESPPVPPLPSEPRSPALPTPRPWTAYDSSTTREELEKRRMSAQVPSTTTTTPMKRASRKLSFTSGMLSFVRKDKDKDKHRNADQLSSFSPLGSQASAFSSGTYRGRP